MISIYPTIYHEFQCKADRCEITCCQLWTIDIDEPTAERYHTMTGPLGESLRQAITIDEEGSHFVFSKEQPMCPLLNEKGLCKVVLELGEEGLCDTCHMHPRFYKYIEDLELCGVGLSCEASVELLAKDDNNRELVFTIEDDDNEFSPDERLKLENVFQLLAFDLEPALFQYTPIPSGEYYKQLLDLFNDVMTEFGETPRILPDDEADGSTDVGNVSYEVPTAQPTLQIGLGLEAHTPEFTCAAGSDYGLEQAIKGAKIMAVVALRYAVGK